MWLALLKIAAKHWEPLLIALLCVGAGLAGYILGAGEQGQIDPPARPDTKRVSKQQQLPAEKLWFPQAPLQITTYRLKDSTVYDTVRVPIRLQGRYNIVSKRPLSISSSRVSLSAFNPVSGLWERHSYSVPEDRWHLSADVGLLYDPVRRAPLAEVEVSGGYRRLRLTARGGYSLSNGPYVLTGIRWRLWKK